MWNGVFSPRVTKASCSHGSTAIWFGEPEYGLLPVYVQFNHTCAGGTTPPSNDTVYTFEIELDSFIDGEDDEAVDLASEVGAMNDSEKLKWLNEQIHGVDKAPRGLV